MDEPKINNALHIADLIAAQLDGRLTPADETELTAWVNAKNLNRSLYERMLDGAYLENTLPVFTEIDTAQALAKVKERLAKPDKPNRRLWPRIAAAASILFILSLGGYFLYNKTHHSPLTIHSEYANDIPPGHDQATLTLADGRKIILRKGLKGVLAQQGNTAIQADANALSYNNDVTPSPLERTGERSGEVLNTLTTRRSEQSPYPLILADGTKVWLNAESSLTFPAEFKGSTRTVKITGEAYFEVVHNAAKPFRVIAGGHTIEDIGTAFDVSAYTDEPEFRTTLLLGSIKLIPNSLAPKERDGVRLIPGQQAIIKNALSTGDVKVTSVDPQAAIAWKNGQFRLDEQRLDQIMRQAARWYDVEVVYQDNALKAEAFGGVTARYTNISELLHALELTKQLRFRIDGRRITVMKYEF